MTRPLHPPSLHRALTLVEMLIVIAVLCLLASLLLPVLKRAVEGSRRTVCMSNLKQLYAMATLYAEDNGDQLPNSRMNGAYHESFNLQPGLPPYNNNGSVKYGVDFWSELIFLRDYVGLTVTATDYYYLRVTNIRGKEAIFCPNQGDERFAPRGAYQFHAFGRFDPVSLASPVWNGPSNSYIPSPMPCKPSVYGSPKLGRIGRDSVPFVFMKEDYYALWGGGKGGVHGFDGINVSDARGAVRWVEVTRASWIQYASTGSPANYDSIAYVDPAWGTFQMRKSVQGATPYGGPDWSYYNKATWLWENTEDTAVRMRIAGYK